MMQTTQPNSLPVNLKVKIGNREQELGVVRNYWKVDMRVHLQYSIFEQRKALTEETALEWWAEKVLDKDGVGRLRHHENMPI